MWRYMDAVREDIRVVDVAEYDADNKTTLMEMEIRLWRPLAGEAERRKGGRNIMSDPNNEMLIAAKKSMSVVNIGVRDGGVRGQLTPQFGQI